MTRPRFRRSLLAIALHCGVAVAAGAQGAPPDSTVAADSAARSTAIVRGGPLLTRRELVASAAVVAGTFAVMPFDRRLAEHVRDRGPQRSGALRTTARAFNTLGDPGTLVIAVGTYGLGRVLRSDHVTDLGLHTTEALALGSTVTGVLKGLAGRKRPYLNRDDPDAFGFAQGFSGGGRTSFPSGHVTAAFAVATAVTAETHHFWPGAPWIVGPLLYAGAGTVGLARMYDDKHWASDVVLGAGIGTISGLAVVRWNHTRPDNRINRWLGVAASPSLVPTAHGLALAWPVGGP